MSEKKTKSKNKKRIISIDFLRIFGVSLIVFFHAFDKRWFSDYEVLVSLFPPIKLFGFIGTVLFIMVSGFSLTYTYRNTALSLRSLKGYFVKRAVRIFPLYWTSMSFIFMYNVFQKKIPERIPIFSYLLSVLALDGFLFSFFKFRALVYVNWFIGFILVLYILFPLVMFLFKKLEGYKVLVTTFVISIITLDVFKGKLGGITYRIPFVRLFEFSLGMLLGLYYQKARRYVSFKNFIITLICASIILRILQLAKPFRGLYILLGISFFLLFFTFPFDNLSERVKNIITALAKKSYGIFLVHHFILNNLSSFLLGKQWTFLFQLKYFYLWLILVFMACFVLTSLLENILLHSASAFVTIYDLSSLRRRNNKRYKLYE